MWSPEKEAKDVVANIPQPKTKLWLIFGVSAATVIVVLGLAWLVGFFSPPPNPNDPYTQNPNPSADLKIKGNRDSKIYHLPECPNYNDISARNVVWFKTIKEAKDAGYRVAKNCP